MLLFDPLLASAVCAVAWSVLAADTLQRLVTTDRQKLLLHAPALVLLLAQFVFALAAFDWLPVHDHLKFVQRNGCAANIDCSDVASWSSVAVHVLGTWLAMVPTPYSFFTPMWLHFGLHSLALALMYAWMFGAARASIGDRRAQLVALFALAFVGFYPPAVRLAVSGVMWPYTLAHLMAAGLALQRARRTNEPWLWMSAAALLVFASLGNFAAAPLAALAAAPALTARGPARRPRWFHVAAALLFAALISGPMLAIAQEVADHEVSRVWRQLVTQLFLFHPMQYPLVLGVLATMGIGIAILRFRTWGVLLLAWLCICPLLASEVSLGVGFPGRFIHGYPSYFLTGALAAVAAEALVRAVGKRRPTHSAVAAALIVVAAAASAHVAKHANAFATIRSAVAAEFSFIAEATPLLPPHRRLIMLPTLYPFAQGLAGGNDPVEVAFPIEAYKTTRFNAAPELGRPEVQQVAVPLEQCPEDTLIYIGTAAHSWVPSELESDAFRQNPQRRPTLQRFIEQTPIEPVRVTRIPAEQHPLYAQRIAGDTVPDVEIGFYRPTCAARTAQGSGDPPPPSVRIKPGQEQTIASFFGEDRLSATFGGLPMAGVAIGADRFTVSFDAAGTSHSLTFAHPSRVEEEAVIATTGSFAATGPCPLSAPHCAELLASVQQHDDGTFWGDLLTEVVRTQRRAAGVASRGLQIPVGAFAISFLLVSLVLRRSRRRSAGALP